MFSVKNNCYELIMLFMCKIHIFLYTAPIAMKFLCYALSSIRMLR